jgi:hypothetical protein
MFVGGTIHLTPTRDPVTSGTVATQQRAAMASGAFVVIVEAYHR